MGIDKANVRVVIHWAPSNSLAVYYQEAGRAGRDNHRSYYRIYYSNAERQFMEHCFRGDSNRIKAKKGLNDDAKDIQIKALQTGFEKMIEYCEKVECRHKMMASFFNESDLKKCFKNCDFCRTPEKVSQQANALKTQRQESLYSRNQRQNGEAHCGKRKKKRNILDSRMEKEEAARLKTAVQDEFERRRKACELANGGATRKRREAIVRTIIQVLDDNSSQAGNQQKAADIEYNSCYLQSKTLSSYNHKAAQVVYYFYLILGYVQCSAKLLFCRSALVYLHY
ncbi:hypothetical protein WR25_25924 [Diploscapter pachys]|uniref:DNA 3'-5' helicase n=1 Tax=Diploscapter pachys TaxID=2018661 RepID=A0A2A2KSK2_9BILA|nr:hypothetical protein WR25_25924 [Diploscapter pachys]